jgi:2-methylaconitate cis-trans-isomerase PrpF
MKRAGAVRMGADQGKGAEWVSLHQKATPKIAWVMPPTDYADSSGTIVRADDCDLVARVVSMGAVHQAFTGTGSLAIAVAGGINDTLVAQAVGSVVSGRPMRLGHTAGCMRVFAEIALSSDGTYRAESAGFTRTARTLMEGHVRVPLKGV